MTESNPLPFDPDAPPVPACTFGGLTLRHTAAGPAWMAPEPRPESAVGWGDTGPGPVYVQPTADSGRGSSYGDPPDPDDAAYTLTTTRGQSGWNTDGGISGYGLTLAAALFYRDAAIAAGAVFPAEEGGT